MAVKGSTSRPGHPLRSRYAWKLAFLVRHRAQFATFMREAAPRSSRPVDAGWVARRLPRNPTGFPRRSSATLYEICSCNFQYTKRRNSFVFKLLRMRALSAATRSRRRLAPVSRRSSHDFEIIGWHMKRTQICSHRRRPLGADRLSRGAPVDVQLSSVRSRDRGLSGRRTAGGTIGRAPTCVGPKQNCVAELPDQSPHSAEADVRPQEESPGLTRSGHTGVSYFTALRNGSTEC